MAHSPRFSRRLPIGVLLTADALALVGAFALAYFARFENPWLPYYSAFSYQFYSTVVFLAIPLWLLVFALYGLYDLDALFGGVWEYARLAQACTLGTMLVVIVSFLYRFEDSSLSRLWLIFAWGLTISAVMLGRFCVRRVVYALRQRGHLQRRALILGTNSDAQAIAEQLQAASSSGLQLLGFVSAGAQNDPLPLPLLGCACDLKEIVARERVHEIIVASTAVTREQLLDTYHDFGLSEQVDVRLSPGLFEILTTGARIKESGYVPLVSLNQLRITGTDAWLKSALDRVLILLSLPLTLPLFLIICLWIKLDSPGAIIHRRRVLGVRGQPFDAFKFRTMVTNADEVLEKLFASQPALREEYMRTWKLKNDPRTTRVGRLLRRASLDELPQVLNVLAGQMSLVGPRMIAPSEIELYGQWWMNLLTVKPGITGPWQVLGRSNLPYDERVRLSMRYIRNHSLWLDVQILYQTIGAVVKGTGAY